MPNERYIHVSLGDVVSWRAEMRELGVERRPPPSSPAPSNQNQADRGYVEQPGEGTPDKPPPSSIPRTPPHSQKPQQLEVIRRPVTPITPPPPVIYVPPPIEREETRQLRALLDSAAPKQATLPLPEAKPTQQQPERVRGEHGILEYTPEFKAKCVARVLAGESQTAVAAAVGTLQVNISRWVRQAKKKAEREASMAARKARKANGARSKRQFYPEDTKTEAIGRVLALGANKGDAARVAREMGIMPESNVNNWVKAHVAAHGKRMPKGYKPAPGATTMVSNGTPKSAVASKPNGASAIQLPPFLQGMEEFVEQIVEKRLEERLKPMILEVMRNTSMLEWMKS